MTLSKPAFMLMILWNALLAIADLSLSAGPAFSAVY
jgi:hypothetical protein